MCGMPGFQTKTAWFAHWIPAFAGMTDINPDICDCPAYPVMPLDLQIRMALA